MKPHFLLLMLLIPGLWSCSRDSCDILKESSVQIEFYKKNPSSGMLEAARVSSTFDSIFVNGKKYFYKSDQSYVTGSLNEGGTGNFLFYRGGTTSAVSFQSEVKQFTDEGPGRCGDYNKYSNVRIVSSGFVDIQLSNTNSYNNDFTAIVIFP